MSRPSRSGCPPAPAPGPACTAGASVAVRWYCQPCAAGDTGHVLGTIDTVAAWPTPRLACCLGSARVDPDHLGATRPALVIDLGTVRTLRRHYPDGKLVWAVRLSTSSGRERKG